MYLKKLLNLMPLFEDDGGATGTAIESVPSDPAADVDLMDDTDWTAAQKEADEEGQPEPEPKQSEPEPKPETMPDTFKVKYNKQEVELTRDQLLEAAQKGLDYDRLREARDRYMTPIERLAQQANMPLDKFIDQLDSLYKYNAVEAKKQELISQGYDEAQAEFVAEMLFENEMMKNGQAAQVRQQDERTRTMQALQERINRDIAEFEAKYPGVDKMPDEVQAEIRQGVSPIVAYQSYLIRENEKKLKAFEQNQKNKDTAAGPAKTTGTEKSDPFLEGLMGN